MSKKATQATEELVEKTENKNQKKDKKIKEKTEKVQPVKNVKQGKQIKIIVIVILACVLAIGAGLGLYFILRDKRKNPVVNAVVAEKTYYAGFSLETVELSLGAGSTEGTIEWKNNSEVLVLGSHFYEYKFTPKDAENFHSKTGTVKVVAIQAQVNSVALKTAPTKVSGYTAFDLFDETGMVLEAIFDSGEKQEFSTGYNIIYQKEDATSLLAGDTKVTISYAGKTCDVEIEEVSKFEVDEPVISGQYVYDGEDQSPEIAESLRYSFIHNAAIDAGDYDIEITLTDTANTMWKNHQADATITLIWTIEEAELNVVENNYSSKFDADSHTVSVQVENNDGVYYSLVELNSDNYQTVGNTEIVSRTDVSSTSVYYYVVGAKNYKDASGELLLEITKANASVNLNQSAYLIFQGMTNVELVTDNVSVVGAKDSIVVHTNKTTFVYYKSYKSEADNTKTTTANGAMVDGGVPTAVGNYFVVAYFEGDETYLAGASTAISYVVEEVNTDLLSTKLPSFDFKSTDETKYFEFKIDNTVSPSSFTFSSSEYTSAVITKVNGFYVFENNYDVFKIQLSADEKTLEITSTSTAEVETFEKWYSPDFVGTYSCNTAYDADNPSILTIYLEDGELKFTFDYKVYQYGGVTGSVISGTVTHDEDLLIFHYSSTFAATWDIENDMIIVERTEADGDYTRVVE